MTEHREAAAGADAAQAAAAPSPAAAGTDLAPEPKPAGRSIRLLVAYDGSGFSGWQRQKENRSVQEELEKALGRMHGHPVAVCGAGRTDSGVHARGQVASFRSDIARIPAERFVPALNSLLPADIRILKSEDAPAAFHPRFDARLRRYRYFCVVGPACPWQLRYAWQLFRRPDIRILNAMASRLIGEHDFSSLSSAQDPSLSRSRLVYEASFRWTDSGPAGQSLLFEVAANAFLWKMVRSIVGTLIYYESTGKKPGDISALLDAKDRSLAGPTAPPQGLFLWNVEYYEPGMRSRLAPWLAEQGDSFVGSASAEQNSGARGSEDAR